MIKFELQGGISKAGFLHIPLLYLGIGRNGFSLTILGVCLLVAWNIPNKEHPIKRLDGSIITD